MEVKCSWFVRFIGTQMTQILSETQIFTDKQKIFLNLRCKASAVSACQNDVMTQILSETQIFTDKQKIFLNLRCKASALSACQNDVILNAKVKEYLHLIRQEWALIYYLEWESVPTKSANFGLLRHRLAFLHEF
jgi:hypothetical protein